MAFNISEFKSNALKNGILKSTLYMVDFTQAAAFPNGLIFFTDSVNIPAVDLDTQQIRRYGYGPIENVPFRPVFNPISMSFIVESSQSNILSAVLNSISSVTAFMNYNNMSTPGVNLYGGSTFATPYEVAYKGDYEFGLTVNVYNELQDTILTYVFNQCYAKEVGSINLGWGNTDQYMKADVTFQYTDYSITKFPTSSIDNVTNIQNIQNALGLSSSSDTLNAIQYPQDVADAINRANARSLATGIYTQQI
jgi:hypothetical protein